MSSVNKVILIGRLTRDPEIRSMGNNKEVASFSLATSDKWKDKATGERKERTEYHNIVIFSPGLINLCKNYIKKGSKLYIEGKIQTKKWTGNDGIEKRTTEIVLQGYNGVLQMLDSKGVIRNNRITEKPVEESDYKPKNGSFVSEEIDDDIPF